MSDTPDDKELLQAAEAASVAVEKAAVKAHHELTDGCPVGGRELAYQASVAWRRAADLWSRQSGGSDQERIAREAADTWEHKAE